MVLTPVGTEVVVSVATPAARAPVPRTVVPLEKVMDSPLVVKVPEEYGFSFAVRVTESP